MVFVDRALKSDWFAFAVARSANKRNLEWGYLGVRVIYGEDIMIAVTAAAAWGERIAIGQCLAVEAVIKLRLFFGVALPAIRRRRRVVRKITSGQIGMAADAQVFSMDGGFICHLIDQGRHTGITVAGQTVFVGYTGSFLSGQRRDRIAIWIVLSVNVAVSTEDQYHNTYMQYPAAFGQGFGRQDKHRS